jgi:hypothetical protein
MRSFITVALMGASLLGGCSSQTIFQSNFATATNQPPSPAQQVGTARVFGDNGSVLVEASTATSGNWVQIGRATQQSGVAGMQGSFAQLAGDGTYTFSTVVYMPSGVGDASIQFEPFGQTLDNLDSFLHLDLTEQNTVRIDDTDGTAFGSFPRDQVFIVQVTLTINATPSAHIVLSGAGASGDKVYSILSPKISQAHQFGAIRLWMGTPWLKTFDVVNAVVTKSQ